MYNTTSKSILFTEHTTISLQNNLHNYSQHSWHECYIQIFYIFPTWIQCWWLEKEGSWLNPFCWFYTGIKWTWKKETKRPVVLPAFKDAAFNQQNVNLLSTNQFMIFFPVKQRVKVALHFYHQYLSFEKYSLESSKWLIKTKEN